MYSPEKMLKASDAEQAAFASPDVGTGPSFSGLDLQNPNVRIGADEMNAPFTTFKPLNVKEYTELLTGPPKIKATVVSALSEFLESPELYKDKIKQQDYLDVLKDLMSTKLGLKKRNPTKKEQEELKKSTTKLNKILINIYDKKIDKAYKNALKTRDVTEVDKLLQLKADITKRNTGGLVGLKQKKSFIPKIIQNKCLREKRQNKKPKGVGASLRGWGAVSG
jgi:hypothetical protein